MKKTIFVGVISGFFAAGAFAAACPATSTAAKVNAGSATAPASGEQCVCDGGTSIKNTVNGGSGAVIPLAAAIFVKNGFDVQCSNNTLVSYNEVGSTAFAVASGSKKGNQTFTGTSNGGAVAVDQKCSGTNDACTPANVTAANGRATTASSSN
jgi:hypothetical protein